MICGAPSRNQVMTAAANAVPASNQPRRSAVARAAWNRLDDLARRVAGGERQIVGNDQLAAQDDGGPDAERARREPHATIAQAGSVLPPRPSAGIGPAPPQGEAHDRGRRGRRLR
jgi:hypothetical protein